MAPAADFTLVMDNAAITEYVMNAGFRKAHLPLYKMVVLGWLAGLFISIGGQTLVSVLVGTTSSGPAVLLGGAFFSLALILILVVGAELFTGNVLIFVAILSRRVYAWEFVWDLFVIYFSNFFGCITFAIIFWGGGVNGFEGDYSAAGAVMCKVATKKSLLPEYQSFLRGIGANICVCLAVMLSFGAKSPSGKMIGIMYPLAVFIVCGFEHSIANQYLFAAATLLRCPGFTQSNAWGELFLCTAGNIIGAMMLSVAYWLAYIHGTDKVLDHVPRAPEKKPSILHRSAAPTPHENK